MAPKTGGPARRLTWPGSVDQAGQRGPGQRSHVTGHSSSSRTRRSRSSGAGSPNTPGPTPGANRKPATDPAGDPSGTYAVEQAPPRPKRRRTTAGPDSRPGAPGSAAAGCWTSGPRRAAGTGSPRTPAHSDRRHQSRPAKMADRRFNRVPTFRRHRSRSGTPDSSSRPGPATHGYRVGVGFGLEELVSTSYRRNLDRWAKQA